MKTKFLLTIFALLLLPNIVFAQAPVAPCVTATTTPTGGLPPCTLVTSSNPLPVTSSAPSGTQDVNIKQVQGAAPSATNPIWVAPATASTPWVVTGSGTAGTAAAGVVSVQGIASMTPFLVTLGAETTKVIGTVNQGTSPWVVSGAVTNAGTFATQAAQSGTWTVQPGNTANTTPWMVSSAASATGGASYLNIAAGQATTVVKGTPGTLYSIVLNSAATATNTTIIYDNATGAGTVIGRPAVVTATVPTTLSYGPNGLAFALGLTIITANANGGDMTVVYK